MAIRAPDGGKKLFLEHREVPPSPSLLKIALCVNLLVVKDPANVCPGWLFT